MKRIILGLTALTVAAAGMQSAQADGGWSTTGKVLTGLVAGSVLVRALAPPPVYVYQAPPAYYSAPVAVAQPGVPLAPTAVTVAPAQPVYAQTVVTQPAPVLYAPAPVYYSAPVVVAPYPIVSFRLGYGGYWRRPYYRRW